MSTEPVEPTTEHRDDDRPLRERIRENPRPALYWLAGVAVLFALEFGRWVGGLLEVASGLAFGLRGLASLPGWVGENVAETFGTLAGAVAADTVALALLFALAVFLHAFLVPVQVVSRLGLDVDRKRRILLDRLALTAVLGLLAGLLAFTPLGTFVRNEIAFVASILESLSNVQTLTSPETIPNQGHRTPDGGWEGTFLGLSPAWAWTLRFAVVWVYALTGLFWAWNGFNVFRRHYRRADWTPTDDVVRRLRNHRWGLFGLVVVFGFVVLAVFASAVAPVPLEHNVIEPFNHEFEYLDDDGEVQSITHGSASINTRSDGSADTNVSPLSYDRYDRWAPLGTTPRGQDMMTHLAYGAQTSLIIGMTAIGLSGFIAVMLSLITAYYKGAIDIIVVLTSDTIIAIPLLLLVMMIVVLFQDANHPIADPLDGGLLLALILAFAYWPGIWRSLRGPSLQVAEEEWVDAARSYGQRPLVTMRKHMAPYILGYIMIYASLLIGGAIIVTAALSFLGLGISPPTPEWGRLIDEGQPYTATISNHVVTISGLMITLVVLAFNALGDGIRDAIDPEADVEGGAAAQGGGA